MDSQRLFRITHYLLNHGKTSASELSRIFEVSVRTIYRDIDALSASGVPVYSAAGRNGGVGILEDHVVERTLLERQEKEDLLVVLKSLEASGNLNLVPVREKLEAVFRQSADDWLEIDWTRWGPADQEELKFETIKKAVRGCEEIEFDYYGSSGTTERRRVRPIKLLFKAYSWYLEAFSIERNDYRVFKLSRMETPSPTGVRFSPLFYPKERLHTCPDNEFFPVSLRFERKAAYRVMDDFSKNDIRWEDGALLVDADIPTGDWILGFLLSYGTAVTVLSPSWLGEMVKNAAIGILGKY